MQNIFSYAITRHASYDAKLVHFVNKQNCCKAFKTVWSLDMPLEVKRLKYKSLHNLFLKLQSGSKEKSGTSLSFRRLVAVELRLMLKLAYLVRVELMIQH